MSKVTITFPIQPPSQVLKGTLLIPTVTARVTFDDPADVRLTSGVVSSIAILRHSDGTEVSPATQATGYQSSKQDAWYKFKVLALRVPSEAQAGQFYVSAHVKHWTGGWIVSSLPRPTATSLTSSEAGCFSFRFHSELGKKEKEDGMAW